MRDELKSYVRRHELSEVGEPVKELFESYNISDNQVQVSETCSQMPEEATRSSDDEVQSSSCTLGTRKLRPRSLNADAASTASTEAAVKGTTQKNTPAIRTRSSLNKNTANSRSFSDNGTRKLERKPQKPSKLDATKEKDKIKKQGKKCATEEGKCIDYCFL